MIAPAHIITTMDYEDVIENHEKTGAEITMVYKKVFPKLFMMLMKHILDVIA